MDKAGLIKALEKLRRKHNWEISAQRVAAANEMLDKVLALASQLDEPAAGGSATIAPAEPEAARAPEITQGDVDRANGWGLSLGLDLCRFLSEEKIELRGGKSAFETAADIVAFVLLAKERIEAIAAPMRQPCAQPETAPAPSPAPALPERDPSKTAEQQGVFRKFEVRRVDGSDQPGGKHYGCEYFVLDIAHDEHARAALNAYVLSCQLSHPQLAKDMAARYSLKPYDRIDRLAEALKEIDELKAAMEEIATVASPAPDDVVDKARKEAILACLAAPFAMHLSAYDIDYVGKCAINEYRQRLAALQPPAVQPKAGMDAQEYAWVIEHRDSEARCPKYFSGYINGTSGWSDNHNDAVRFARHRDAEIMRDTMFCGMFHRIAEHGWAPVAPTSDTGGV